MSQNRNADAEINALLVELWQRHLPATRERLNILERAAQAASTNSLNEPARADAQAIAHKLSGNLGMFGHQQAGAIAGEIERLFKTFAPETAPRIEPLVRQLRQALASYL
ncbi:Hpt domain-containing protein [Edaphobacter aggregans]|uniref:Hpt domain-containing protein n=1 Tax=Edaphobacter aggregans TaxID=570835 RepID=UPI00068BE8D2|nr:Hpt domain-containing protein [Edaphobacter aggregans]